jgi:hypothetical protein
MDPKGMTDDKGPEGAETTGLLVIDDVDIWLREKIGEAV